MKIATLFALFFLPLFGEEFAFQQGLQSYHELEIDSEFGDFDLKKHGQALPHPRSYMNELSHSEKNDIHYIVTTLANDSLVSIALHRASLESAGDRIDHIHPLRFLMTVFTNEELKVGIRNIRARGWIWGDFVSGIRESLVNEAAIGNVTLDHVRHLAKSLDIDPGLIIPHAQKHHWEELIETLIAKVPRKGDHERYDS